MERSNEALRVVKQSAGPKSETKEREVDTKRGERSEGKRASLRDKGERERRKEI